MATTQFINLAVAGSPGAASSSLKPTTPHTRSYQACIPCRSRKVKCDLGAVDTPHEPPCLRCKREQKECYFSSTRRKRKPDERDETPQEAELGAYEQRNSRKRTKDSAEEVTAAQENPLQSQRLHPATAPRPLTPGGSLGQARPLRRPTSHPSSVVSEDDVQISDNTAALLQKTELYNGHDALNLLYEAAGQTGDLARYNGSTYRTDATANRAPHGLDAASISNPYGNSNHNGSHRVQDTQPTSSYDKPVLSPQEPGIANALRAWSKLRFVRGQWFTATEAISYIDYFYRFLNPLTPITIPDFQNPSTHPKLLYDEPMLAVTILTLASRYMNLRGPGARSRSFAIHEKLWNYLQGMIDRLIWGQEQFGGGSGGLGFQTGGSDPPSRPKGLRTLGTVESLLMLTEWHTRALHFPPGDDNNELLVENDIDPSISNDTNMTEGIAGRRIDSWLEPCWRSDRMCWSLLANAKAIAYELGVFDVSSYQSSPVYSYPRYRSRAENVRRLLYIYITQTSGRLSLPSMLHDEHTQDLFSQSTTQAANFTAPQPSSTSLDGGRSDSAVNAQNATLYYWCSIAKLMKEANHDLFRSRQFTRDVIASGEYVDRLETLRAKLRKWKNEFDKCDLISQLMRHILNIEYHYARVYMNTVALQAIVDRCTQSSKSDDKNDAIQQAPGQNRIIPPQTLAKWLEGDRRFIRDIVSESQSLLRVILDGLLPQEYLKFAPVRTYFRIVTVSIFLLKTFAIGASESDVNLSMSLLDRVTHALNTCIVDDVHVGNRHAELLGTLMNRVKARIIRVATKQGDRTPHGKAPRMSASEGAVAAQTNQGHQPLCNSTNLYEYATPQEAWKHAPKPVDSTYYPWPTTTTETSPASKSPWNPSADAMQGISLTPFDFDFRNPSSSIMPPPTFSFDNPNGLGDYMRVGGASDSPYSANASQQSDWFALPLDPIINFNDGDVRNISYGPDLSGKDMLEVLLGEPLVYDGPQSSFGTAGAYAGDGGGSTVYGPISGARDGLDYASK